MVRINGEMLDVAGQTIAVYLASANYDTGRIAIEKNGEIVPKADYSTEILRDGDSLEIVNFVGGG